MLRELLLEIGSRFLEEKQKSLKENDFADYVRNDGKDILREVIGDENLLVKASVGAGNWAEIVWLGIFNVESTTSATSGIYIVYLFTIMKYSDILGWITIPVLDVYIQKIVELYFLFKF